MTPNELPELLAKVVAVAPVALHKFRLRPDGTMAMPYTSPAIAEICGMTPERLGEDFSPAWELIHRDDRGPLLAAIETSARTMTPFSCEWRVRHPERGEIWVACRSNPEPEPDGEVVWYGYFHDITAPKRAEQERLAHLRYREQMDLVNQALTTLGTRSTGRWTDGARAVGRNPDNRSEARPGALRGTRDLRAGARVPAAEGARRGGRRAVLHRLGALSRDGVPEDADDMAIVQTTIVLARQLRLKVMAEGVESEAPRAVLTANGCAAMQGYLFGAPMLPEEMERAFDLQLGAGVAR